MEIGAWKFELQSCARIFMVATVPHIWIILEYVVLKILRLSDFLRTITYSLFNESTVQGIKSFVPAAL